MLIKFIQVPLFAGHAGSTVRRDAQEAALRSAALWREMPLPQLLKDRAELSWSIQDVPHARKTVCTRSS